MKNASNNSRDVSRFNESGLNFAEPDSAAQLRESSQRMGRIDEADEYKIQQPK